MRKALLAVLVLALAGCTNLPTSGSVQFGGPLETSVDTQVQFLASGPVDGATQQEILEGFLAAGAAAQDNYRVARMFLTDDFAAEWKPLQESIVRGGGSSVASVGASELSFSTTVDARVTRGGFYTPEDAGASQSFAFQFDQVDGEWRILQAPDAVFVSATTFESVYQPYAVYFYNQSRTQFVPDLRYFPRAGDPATEVARAVIAGPSEFLPYSSTAFPETATLVASPVEIADGRALVDVSREVLDASNDDQRAMLSQMAVSLQAIAGISTVALTVDRAVLSITPTLTTADALNPLVNENALIVDEGEFGFAVGGRVDPIGRIADRVVELAPVSVSFHDTGVAAVGTASSVYFVGDSTLRVSNTPSLVEPQIDGSDSVWWVSPDNPAAIRVFGSGASNRIEGPWGSKGRIVSLEVSREDARLAVAVESTAGHRLYVASIGRDAEGRVTAVSGFHRLPIEGASIIDIAWADALNVAVITRTVSGYTVELASVGGITTSIGQPTSPATIVGGNGRSELVIRSRDGQLWQPRAGGWQAIGLTADLLATQH
jgi:hypothetical protein